jgi:hypothetical protein
MPEKEIPSFDFEAIKSGSPESVLSFFLEQRRTAIAEQLKLTSENPNSSKIYLSNKDFFTPVNPLLIATAICLSMIRNDDFKLILGRYTSGFAIPDLEPELLKLPSFSNEEQLNCFLHLEEKYVQAFCTISLKNIIVMQAQVLNFEEIKPTCSNLVLGKEFTFNFNWDIDKYDVFWQAWLIANGTYSMLQPIEEIECTRARVSDAKGETIKSINKTLFYYGAANNSEIHNIREFYEYQLNESQKKFNKVLRSKLTGNQKKNALLEAKLNVENASKLVERSRRFYHWNPAEIDAHQFTERHTGDIFQALVDKKNSQND